MSGQQGQKARTPSSLREVSAKQTQKAAVRHREAPGDPARRGQAWPRATASRARPALPQGPQSGRGGAARRELRARLPRRTPPAWPGIGSHRHPAPGLGSGDPSDGTSEAPRACPARCRDRAPPACPPARPRAPQPPGSPHKAAPLPSRAAPPHARATRPLTGGSAAALALPPAPSDERRPPPAAPTVTSGVTRLPLSRAGPPCACAGRGRQSVRPPFCGGPRGPVPRGQAAPLRAWHRVYGACVYETRAVYFRAAARGHPGPWGSAVAAPAPCPIVPGCSGDRARALRSPRVSHSLWEGRTRPSRGPSCRVVLAAAPVPPEGSVPATPAEHNAIVAFPKGGFALGRGRDF